MKRFKLNMSVSLALLLLITLLLPIISMAAETTVNLGSASNFSLLAGSTITNTGTTTIDGSVGLHPGTSFSGQGTATIGGAIHLADAVALQAKNDFLVAYTNAQGRVGNTIGSELGGSTLTPGVYSTDTSMQITGTLTLDGKNDSNAVFILKAGSTLTTASNSSIVLINGANPNNIFWQVGTSATLGTNSQFKGNVLAMESITMATGAAAQGKLFAMTGAITLDSNTISNFILVPVTTAAPTTAAPTTAAPTTDVGESTTAVDSTTAEGVPVTTTASELTTGSLTVSKVVSGYTGTMALPAFAITVTGPENFTITKSFTQGEAYTWTNLVPGVYVVTESRVGLNANWTVNGEGTVQVYENQLANATITNTYELVDGIPQTGQETNYTMAITLGMMSLVVAAIGMMIASKHKRLND